MSSRDQVTFQEALEIEIIRKRRLERRRESLADNIKEAQAEYARGESSRGSAADLMREIGE